MLRLLPPCVVLSSLALFGCTTTLAPVPGAAATTTSVAVSAPVIANLDVPTKAVIGAEQFELSFDVVKAGSGTIAQYGVASRLGSAFLKPEKPIPIIDHGHVHLGAAGPIPNPTVAGDLICEFWVVDSNNQESNHLPFTMKIQ